MPVQVKWLIENQVILITGVGHNSPQDIDQYSQEVFDLLENTSAVKAHLIFDLGEVLSMPLNPKAYTTLKWNNHPKLGWVVVINIKNPVFAFITSVAAQAIRRHYYYTKTLELALEYLQNADTTLKD